MAKETKKSAAKEKAIKLESGALEKKEAVAIEPKKSRDIQVKEVAKAGKRSAKSIKESEEKAAKDASKLKSPGDQKQQIKKGPRSRIERAGKNYREAAKLIEKDKVYSLEQAVGQAVNSNPVKFDATVELHVNLGVDPKQAEQNVRATVVLPAGSGKTQRVAAFVEDNDIADVKKAGADLAGADQIEQQLAKEEIDFDILIATPALMARLSKYARFLGPRGLMPNPKSGTVTNNVAGAIKEAKSGRVEYRVDANGIIHMGVGKVSFGPEKILDNTSAALNSIKSSRPSSLKGIYIKSVHISTTMGPSIKTEFPK